MTDLSKEKNGRWKAIRYDKNLHFGLAMNYFIINETWKQSSQTILPFFQENLKSLIPWATQSRNCYFALNGRRCDALIVCTTRSGLTNLIGWCRFAHACPSDPMWRRNGMSLYLTRGLRSHRGRLIFYASPVSCPGTLVLCQESHIEVFHNSLPTLSWCLNCHNQSNL